MLFVSSFGNDLFEASGKRLIESFLDKQKEGRLLICKEGNWKEIKDGRIMYFDFDRYAFLQNWLKQNEDVIPDYLGGKAKECRCSKRHIRHSRHKPKCHWQWMNRNASRWFRKVASYKVANKFQDRFTVWIDADAYFIRNMPEQFVKDTLFNNGLVYCKGHRESIESGVLFFDLEKGGSRLIKEHCKQYTSRSYLTYKRWDDGYQLGVLVKRMSRYIKTKDLVHPTKYKGKTNDVIPRTSISKYIVHEKGRHGVKLNIMR